MKHSVSLSGWAEADLTNQYRWYLDHATVEVAERFLKAFDARTQLLTEFPEIGQPRRFRAPELRGVRSLAVGKRFGDHLIFYRADGKTVSIGTRHARLARFGAKALETTGELSERLKHNH